MFTLYTPSLYSLSILLSTIPLYNPLTHPTLRFALYTPTLRSLSILLWYPTLYHQPPHPFLQLVQLNRRWAPHWSQDNPPYMTNLTPLYNSHSIVLLYLLSAPPFYIPSQHPFFTPSLLPIYPPFGSPPFDTPSLRSYSILPLYTPNLSSSLPFHSTTPFYN